jgi:protein gp37
MKNSAIQWTDHTFNPWEGCTKVAPECAHCYAEVLVDHRFGRVKWGKGQPRRRTSENLWKQPLQWNRFLIPVCKSCGQEFTARHEESCAVDCPQCAKPLSYRAQRVFCLSLGDWLDEEVPIEWLADLLALIHATPNLDWQLLTKRPQNWLSLIDNAFDYLTENEVPEQEWLGNWIDGRSPSNIWIGVSAGADQKAVLEIPAKIHFLSCEPMLHEFDTTHATGFDWIIFGGESGKNARPCSAQWIGEGVEFCQRNKIAPFVKQLGANVRDVVLDGYKWPNGTRGTDIFDPHTSYAEIHLVDSHGGDWNEWPKDLRVREFPA